MRVDEVTELTASLCLKANFEVRPDVAERLRAALEEENPPTARLAIEQLLENMEVAKSGSLPLCQDCGYVTVLAEVGQEVDFDGPFVEAVQAGVAAGYERGHLRRSVIRHALSERVRPEEESPAKVYTELVPGDSLRLTVTPKGGGSDNACHMRMMRPTAGEDEIVDFVVASVGETGVNACPPLVIGVAVGGSFDSVALSSKKVLLRKVGGPSEDPAARILEERLLREVNELGIGAAGLGGPAAALGVAVDIEPTHMACLPVAVNISCNQLRSAAGEL